MIFSINIDDTNSANHFLRALWAEIRKEYSFGWQYAPYKDGKNNRIIFGWMGLGLDEGPVTVSITYGKRGSIKDIIFNLYDQDIPENSKLCEVITKAVNNAQKNQNSTHYWTFCGSLETNWGKLASYKGERFEIYSPDKNRINLLISVAAYDEVDAKHGYRKKLLPIMDVLSVETNMPIWASKKKLIQKSTGAEFNKLFTNDMDWIDGFPVQDKYITISEKCKDLLDIIAKEDIVDETYICFLRACKLYHTARKHEYSIMGIDSNLHFGDSTLDFIPVLYMSAVEVAASIGVEDNDRCPTCGQVTYKISDRVSKFASELLEAKHMGKVFKDYYTRRSKSLHVGISMSTQSYAGVSIPQLDKEDPNGCQTQSKYSSLNMREYVSFCLRKVLQCKVEIHK